MIALSSTKRNTRGLSFPGCSLGHTDPISTKPKPVRCKPSTASPCLSNPAAIPIGFDRDKFNNFVFCKKKMIKFSFPKRMKVNSVDSTLVAYSFSYQYFIIWFFLLWKQFVFESEHSQTMARFWWTQLYQWHQTVIIKFFIVPIHTDTEKCAN